MIAEIGRSLLHFLQALSAFNYQLVSLVLKAALETWRSATSVAGVMCDAFVQLGGGLLNIGQEMSMMGTTFMNMWTALGRLVWHVLIVLCSALEQIIMWIASHLSHLLHYCYNTFIIVLEYFSLSSVTILEVLKYGASTTFQYLKNAAEVSLQYCSMYAVILFKKLAQCLLQCKYSIKRLANVLKENCVNVLNETTRLLKILYTYVTTNIPLEFYVWLLGIVCAAFILRCVGQYLSRKGLTFPSFSSVNNDIIITLDDSDVDIIESSDEEIDYADEDEIETESQVSNVTGEDITEISDEDSDVLTSSSLTNSEEDEEDDDDVLEYEVGSDSEDEEENGENDQNRINVQLPERTETRTLRSRATPSLDDTCTKGKLAPHELEKVLERERDRRACVVCQDAVKCVLVLPCRHMCLCVECAHEIASARIRQRRICPLCRSQIETIMNVFL